MKNRCFNPRNKNYPNYGGRGITVCDEWKSSYTNFLNDMGECPDGFSIERIDVNGNYCPENCEWIPMSDQSKNRRCVRHMTLGGETKSIIDWCRFFSIDRKVVDARIKNGWPSSRLFSAVRFCKKRI
jgi:hypothetical protein